MSAASAIATRNANLRSAVSFTESEQRGGLNAIITECVRKIFPRKCWVELTILLRLSERTAKHRLAGTREFSAAELADLIRSEHGLEVLAAIIGSAKPTWWVRFKTMATFIDARVEANAAARKAKEAMDALAETNTIIGQAAARFVQDEEFHRSQVDAMCAVAGAARGAMASKSGRGRFR